MGYTALYRKFRPDTFEDVKGQDHIVKTLKNQIRADRAGHAYLFCGTRGTGKTTIAKILAKAVNCEHPIDGSPCNECASCRAIAAGASMNVIEIDAASNNGVENIREIREEVAYPPTEGKYKVYIIDEVHMLSIGAFNALLKNAGGAAVVCDLYSGDDRSAQNSGDDSVKMPALRFPENQPGDNSEKTSGPDGTGTRRGRGKGTALRGAKGRRLDA